MKITITINPKYKKRLQITVPEKALFWIREIERVKNIYPHGNGKYSLMYFPSTIWYLQKQFGDAVLIAFDQKEYPPFSYDKSVPKAEDVKETIEPKYKEAVDKLEEWILLKQYSIETLKSYKCAFRKFLFYYNEIDPKDITGDQIKSYILHLIKTEAISESSQNQIINAVKCYYEKVLRQERTVYHIDRPKKKQTLPQVLSPDEVHKILCALPNLKHRTILMLKYSAGLRLGEVIRLRLEDILIEQNKVFVKGGKNKKDRYTLLSKQVLVLCNIKILDVLKAEFLIKSRHARNLIAQSYQGEYGTKSWTKSSFSKCY